VNGEAAITRDVGVGLTVPVSYVSVDVQRSEPLWSMGDPLLFAKYRLHLPEVEGRQPVFTIRARWGLPISPPQKIKPTTTLIDTEFAGPTQFADTYAFTLEKHDFGLGVNTAYQIGMFHISAQVYGDYFLSTGGIDQANNFMLSYGGSFGVRPLGDLVGAYAEVRGTSEVSGGSRGEIFGYLGARMHVGNFEPAIWLALPFGSVSTVSPFQIGGELRVSFDVEGVIVKGREREGDTSDLFNR
jgi:hypothetical protein